MTVDEHKECAKDMERLYETGHVLCSDKCLPTCRYVVVSEGGRGRRKGRRTQHVCACVSVGVRVRVFNMVCLRLLFLNDMYVTIITLCAVPCV